MSSSLELQIKSLEAQLSALKVELANRQESEPQKRFSDLCGILKGKVDSTEEDIEAAHYHFTWEGEEIR